MSQDRNPPITPRSPFCMRLSDNERALLTKWALSAGLSNGEYVRHQLFGADRSLRRTRGRNPVVDQKALGEVLSALGSTRAGSNLNQLAKAVNSGSLVFDEGARLALLEACADFREIRDLLMRALGICERS